MLPPGQAAAYDLPGLPALGRTRVVGVVNVTPDSFSDGGAYLDVRAAVEHGLLLARQGADLLDIGGESTRPGADRVDPKVELGRVLPVVSALASRGLAVSIDTSRASVAGAALEAGAIMVNDVSGGVADAAMAPLVARSGVAYVLMHARGDSRDMRARAVYDDVLAEVGQELAQRLTAVVAAGVDPAQVVLDPGIGFHKTPEQNWPLLRGLGAFAALGRPLLVGASRKSFLGTLLAGPDGEPRPVTGRDGATHALTALVAAAGAWGVRVHDVAASADAVRVAAAWVADRAAMTRAGAQGW